MNNELEQLREQTAIAARLEAMGVHVRSVELRERNETVKSFVENGGNRAMRRAAKRGQRKRGS